MNEALHRKRWEHYPVHSRCLWIIFVGLEKINNLKKWYAVWLRNWLLCLLASCLSWELAFEGKAQIYITKVHEATTNHELLRNISMRPMFSSNQRGNEALHVLWEEQCGFIERAFPLQLTQLRRSLLLVGRPCKFSECVLSFRILAEPLAACPCSVG